ncbi:ATP-binding protein [Aquabacterium sp. J223]|uniref:ATP-binding protein n=1 Tax=Aquabacterium sp. J223 TaxID=2898431 RepID=UPI0021AD5280|nr:ATP-binding protein [Aquabacterium sp. J223]UUX95221.1 ATP-binding protein [Aquabacterium sp. J223]
MTMLEHPKESGGTVLVWTRQEVDASVIGLVCRAATFDWRVVADTVSFCRDIEAAAVTAVVVSEEALHERMDAMARCLREQPRWSDIPVIVLTFANASQRLAERWQALRPLGNVTLLERPLRVETMRAALFASRRTRERQYLLRDHMAALEQSAQKLEEAVRQRTAELEAALRDLQVAEKALVQSQRLEAVGQLTGGVAHDFNNLLQVISSSTALLERQRHQPELAQRPLELIRRTTERGARLTQQLLAFASRQPLVAQRLDVSHVLLALKPLLERSLRDDIVVHLRMPHDVWPVRADATQLEVALLNLAINARDAMPHGGELTIEVSNVPGSEANGRVDAVSIAVTDTGHGMTEQVAARVFEPFFSTKAAQGKGTGLGLSQVYGFVRQSGGEVWLRHSSPSGTCFVLTLPRDHVEGPVASVGAVAAAVGDDGDLRTLRPTVLVVDDDVEVASATCALLGALGCRCHTARSGDEALTRAKADDDIDVVLSDVLMPGALDGLQLRDALKAWRPSLPVLLTSGYVGAPRTTGPNRREAADEAAHGRSAARGLDRSASKSALIGRPPAHPRLSRRPCGSRPGTSTTSPSGWTCCWTGWHGSGRTSSRCRS